MGEAKNKKEAHIDELLKRAIALNLSGVEDLFDISTAELARSYNGCGPEWLPSAVREKLTEYFAIFEPAFLIHDLRFTFSDGSTADFNAANTELEYNLLRIAKATYAWYNWRRYRALAAADIITCACDRFGWIAYISAGRMKGSAVEVSGSGRDVHSTPTPKNYPSKSLLLFLCISCISWLTPGCYRSIELVREGEYALTYTAVGLKTDVSKIEAEKMTNGTVRVLVEGVATDVSERNAKIIESSGTAVGNIAQKVVEGMK
jgi:hypothetical protein